LEAQMKKVMISAAVAALMGSAAANAAESVTYTYDAKGRLVRVVRSGSVNNNVQVQYTYDKANNRKTTTTTGSSN
jgi:hypothetical protein